MLKLAKILRYGLTPLLLVLLLGESQPLAALDYAAGKAMGSANSALSRGIFCIGVNPANLGLASPYRTYFSVGSFSYQITNNFYNLASGQIYGGQDLAANNRRLQDKFLSELPEDGWRLNWLGDIALPLANFSVGNKAFTTRIISTADFYISRPVLDVIFGGMTKGERYQLDLRCDAMTAVEYAYSMAIPYEKMAIGLSLKYLHGIGYYGLDPAHSTGILQVDTANFVLYGSGDYYFRESYAGRGFGIDFGLAFTNLQGWDFGISFLNVGEYIQWNSETVLSKTFKDGILKYMGSQVKSWPFKNSDLKLDFSGEDFHYTFQIDSINGQALFRGDSTYGSIFRSQATTLDDTAQFRLRIPLVLKIGLARQLSNNLTAGLDFTASFEDRLYFRKGWRMGLGCEYRYLPKIPLRLGIAFGDLSGWEFDIGSGFKLGVIHFDWALGFHRGIWAHTARGLTFALGAYITGKEQRK